MDGSLRPEADVRFRMAHMPEVSCTMMRSMIDCAMKVYDASLMHPTSS